MLFRSQTKRFRNSFTVLNTVITPAVVFLIGLEIKNTMAGVITVLNPCLLYTVHNDGFYERKESPRKHLYKVILHLVNGKHGVHLNIWQ